MTIRFTGRDFVFSRPFIYLYIMVFIDSMHGTCFIVELVHNDIQFHVSQCVIQSLCGIQQCPCHRNRCQSKPFPHSRLTPRKIYYTVSLPPWGNVYYIVCIPHSKPSYLLKYCKMAPYIFFYLLIITGYN